MTDYAPIVYLTVSETFNRALEIFKKNALFLIVLTLIISVISGVISSPSQLANTFLEPALKKQNWGMVGMLGALMGGVTIVGTIVGAFLTMNRIKIFLRIYDGETADYADLFRDFNQFLNFLGGYMLYGLIVAAGFMLLIVPGVYWALKYSMTTYLMVDQGLSPMEAIRKSGQLTDGHKGELFVIVLAMFGIILVGMLACCVGVLAASPIVEMMWTDCYRRLMPAETATEFTGEVETIMV